MEWYDNYNIGIKLIDEQHRELVTMVSKLQKALSTDAERSQTGETIKFLVDYTRTHFADEESLMNQIGYPDLEQHRRIHKKLIGDITEILIRLKKGKSFNAMELIDFLTEWLMHHITQEDKKIGRFLERSTIAAPDYINPEN
ncbi:MAG: bacteriohemerythrin [Proteobacteria bacterium]|nr:bacteriohemerythrin [Pseudomonadota bacterium]MBU1739247.1 bacteriohemerythrin [Pseudomonadota bacterium]